MELKEIFKMKINERTVAVNQYGTNMIKYKYDSLAVIEAKFAMTQGEDSKDSNQTVKITDEEGCGGVEISTQQTQPSPRAGSQEAPEAIWSSQEGEADKQKEGEVTSVVPTDEGGQSPNWEALKDTPDKGKLEEVNTKEDEEEINEDKTGRTSSPHEKIQDT
jgi:hypothetical protein